MTGRHLLSLSETASNWKGRWANGSEEGGVVRLDSSKEGYACLGICQSPGDTCDASVKSPFDRSISPFAFSPSVFIAWETKINGSKVERQLFQIIWGWGAPLFASKFFIFVEGEIKNSKANPRSLMGFQQSWKIFSSFLFLRVLRNSQLQIASDTLIAIRFLLKSTSLMLTPAFHKIQSPPAQPFGSTVHL